MKLGARWLATLVGLTFLVAGCSSGPAPVAPAQQQPAAKPAAAESTPAKSAPATPAAQPAAKMEKLKVAVAFKGMIMQEASYFVALEKGIFQKHGVEVESLPMEGDPIAIKALLADQVDIGFNSNPTVYVGNLDALRTKIFVEPTPVQTYTLVTTPQVKTWKDLEGKSLGTSGPSGISYHLPRAVLVKNGVDVNKVNFVSVGGSGARSSALKAGKIDSTVLHVDWAVPLSKSGGANLLSSMNDEMPKFQMTALHAKVDLLKNRREAIQRFVDALLEAENIVRNDKAQLWEVYRKYWKDAATTDMEAEYDIVRKAGGFDLAGGMKQDAFDFTVDFLVQIGDLKNSVKSENVYDRSFVEAAKKKQG